MCLITVGFFPARITSLLKNIRKLRLYGSVTSEESAKMHGIQLFLKSRVNYNAKDNATFTQSQAFITFS